MSNKAALRVGMLALVLSMGGMGIALAEPPHGGPRGEHFDAHYGHNHAYPARGAAVGVLPRDNVAVMHGGGRYYYSGGVWYAPRGPGFAIVGPPTGVFVPVLPVYYTTIWVGGLPYYYANDTYYVYAGPDQGYEVVDPPNEASTPATTEPPANGTVFVYPRNGQSPQQTDQDKYECHKWAQGQTGFDPTQNGGGVPPDQAEAKAADYQKAMAACLEGRGYSVR